MEIKFKKSKTEINDKVHRMYYKFTWSTNRDDSNIHLNVYSMGDIKIQNYRQEFYAGRQCFNYLWSIKFNNLQKAIQTIIFWVNEKDNAAKQVFQETIENLKKELDSIEYQEWVYE